ncbi:hypothetical protein ACWHAM_19495 [Paenibacillus terrae]
MLLKKFFSVGISMVLCTLPVLASAEASLEVEPLNSNIHVDSSITGASRDIMLDVMKDIPIEERENVVYIRDTGEILANKSELLKEWSNATKIGLNTFETKDGQLINAPESTDNKTSSISAQSVSCPSSDGPYRKVQSNTGYSWFSGYVYLPSQSKKELYDENYGSSKGNGDTAHIYSGGSAGTEVDAGFFHQSTNDNWAMFVRQGGYSNGSVFAAGQNVFLKFYVPSNNRVALYAAGKIVNSNETSITVIRDASGWDVKGSGVSLKRNTTIASKSSPHSGSFIRGVHWYNSYIGTSSTNNSLWQSTNQTAGYCTVPSSQVTVNYVNAGEETVNIKVP